MEKEKSNNIITIILVTITLALAVFLVLVVTGKIDLSNNAFGNSDNKTEGKNVLPNNNEDTTNGSDEQNMKEKLEDIEDKYLFALYGYTDLNGINNQVTMKAVLINSSFYPNPSFTKKQLDEAFQNSIFSKMPLVHEDFWFNGYNSDVAPTYTYNKDTETYTANPVGKGACRVSPAYKKVIDYTENNDEYTIKYKYVWFYGCEGSQPDVWYGKYYEAQNQNAPIYKMDISKYDHGIIKNEDLKTEIENNWSSIENKLDTYIYTFKYENNHLVLTNFRKTEA